MGTFFYRAVHAWHHTFMGKSLSGDRKSQGDPSPYEPWVDLTSKSTNYSFFCTFRAGMMLIRCSWHLQRPCKDTRPRMCGLTWNVHFARPTLISYTAIDLGVPAPLVFCSSLYRRVVVNFDWCVARSVEVSQARCAPTYSSIYFVFLGLFNIS